jgi:hypothetical protein
MNFLADANATEDEKFLANLWLDKFNHWRDTVPQRDDTNKRPLKPTDRYAPPDIPDPPILKSTRAPPLKASIPKIVDVSTTSKSTSAASSDILPSQLGESKPALIAPAINDKVLFNWQRRFEIQLKQMYSVEDGDQNS